MQQSKHDAMQRNEIQPTPNTSMQRNIPRSMYWQVVPHHGLDFMGLELQKQWKAVKRERDNSQTQKPSPHLMQGSISRTFPKITLSIS
jgi:hypothetical protein